MDPGMRDDSSLNNLYEVFFFSCLGRECGCPQIPLMCFFASLHLLVNTRPFFFRRYVAVFVYRLPLFFSGCCRPPPFFILIQRIRYEGAPYFYQQQPGNDALRGFSP